LLPLGSFDARNASASSVNGLSATASSTSFAIFILVIIRGSIDQTHCGPFGALRHVEVPHGTHLIAFAFTRSSDGADDAGNLGWRLIEIDRFERTTIWFWLFQRAQYPLRDKRENVCI
jgi:hypothetical protein